MPPPAPRSSRAVSGQQAGAVAADLGRVVVRAKGRLSTRGRGGSTAAFSRLSKDQVGNPAPIVIRCPLLQIEIVTGVEEAGGMGG